MPINVALVGASGYTGLEAIKLLNQHPDATVRIATARADAGQPISSVHPSLAGRTDLMLELLDADKIASTCDVALCCLPHGASAETVKGLCSAGVRVIDFSADFRLSSKDVYEQWYQVTHPWPERVGKTVYGLPEFFADDIRDADLVANPGCNSTSAILPVAPLVKENLIDTADIIVDSKCGVSGAGRGLKLATLYCEANESVAAYAVGCHRHTPEIEDIVERISGRAVRVIFTPHLTPLSRGIYSTVYVRPTNESAEATVDRIMQCWRDTYRQKPFISVVDHLPATAHVVGTNYVQLSARASGDRVILLAAIDNLAKGASGAAVQNMNVMFGLDQQSGLF